jgi:hypothetical protein
MTVPLFSPPETCIRRAACGDDSEMQAYLMKIFLFLVPLPHVPLSLLRRRARSKTWRKDKSKVVGTYLLEEEKGRFS